MGMFRFVFSLYTGERVTRNSDGKDGDRNSREHVTRHQQAGWLLGPFSSLRKSASLWLDVSRSPSLAPSLPWIVIGK